MPPPGGWDNFFVAEAGAAAALSGLVFVSVSISLQTILGNRHLRARAVETLLTLLSVLAIATCGLIPNQSCAALGAEIGSFGLLVWVTGAGRHLRAYRDPNLESEARRWLWVRIVGGQASSLPFVAAGILLLAGHPGGLVWVAPGTLASFLSSALNAWVLLVEIQR
jgi:modulator of FtsH protease